MQAIFRRKSFFDASRASVGTCCLRKDCWRWRDTRYCTYKKHRYFLYKENTTFYLALCGISNYCVLPSRRHVLFFWHWAHVEGYVGGILDCPSWLRQSSLSVAFRRPTRIHAKLLVQQYFYVQHFTSHHMWAGGKNNKEFTRRGNRVTGNKNIFDYLYNWYARGRVFYVAYDSRHA